MSGEQVFLEPTDDELNLQSKAIAAALGAIMYLTRENEGMTQSFFSLVGLKLKGNEAQHDADKVFRRCLSHGYCQMLDTRRMLADVLEGLADYMSDSDGDKQLPDEDATAFAFRALELAASSEEAVKARAKEDR